MGRQPIAPELRTLIRRMTMENRVWDQRRIQPELARLGFTVSARTIAKYMHPTHRHGPSFRWQSFLMQHASAIWACDFFCVQTITFRTLYVFFVIHKLPVARMDQLLYMRGEPAGHDSDGSRREIMRLNKLITGKEIWAGRSMTKRIASADSKLSKVIRLNASHDDGRASLGQAEIARWPHEGSCIDLGRLGGVIPSSRLPSGRQHIGRNQPPRPRV